MEILFSPQYLQDRSKHDPKTIEKLEQAMEVHGYRGASKKKHNGVVNLKPTDNALVRTLQSNQLQDDAWLATNRANKTFVANVKVVAHCPDGTRAVGCLFKDEHNVHSLLVHGISNYDRKKIPK
jgi:hypothetical protein